MIVIYVMPKDTKGIIVGNVTLSLYDRTKEQYGDTLTCKVGELVSWSDPMDGGHVFPLFRPAEIVAEGVDSDGKSHTAKEFFQVGKENNITIDVTKEPFEITGPMLTAITGVIGLIIAVAFYYMVLKK